MDGKEGVVRYSDSDLAEFKAVIEKKMALAKEQLDSLQEQIMEISENIGDEHGGDWVDDSSNNSDVEMLNNMAIRQRKFIQDLDNALVRIRNKVYGICVVTGELIDKRRLLAVPTTTKSLSAKTDARKLDEERMITGPTKTPYVKGNDDDEEEEEAAKKKKKPTKPKIISKIIRKPSATPAQSRPPIDEDDEDEDDNLYIDDMDLPPIDDDDEQEDDIETTDEDVDFDELPADDGDDED